MGWTSDVGPLDVDPLRSMALLSEWGVRRVVDFDGDDSGVFVDEDVVRIDKFAVEAIVSKVCR